MKTVIETGKDIIRWGLLLAPYWSTFVTNYREQGLMLAISGFLIFADRVIHHSDRTKLRGIVPF